MITFEIDMLTPCLQNTETGEIYDTEVVRLVRKSFLGKFNGKTGWYVNWSKFHENVEIYALVLKGTMDIQGLLAVENDDMAKAIHIVWTCTAPQNNIWRYGVKRYSGVGGHLLAIAAELSQNRGYEGDIYAEAMDEALYNYYEREFSALSLPAAGHPYRFMLTDTATKRIREVYSYDWTEEKW